jgi:hypothetical protein
MAIGPHPIEVIFFERGGGAGCKLEYSGPDTGYRARVVPEKVLLPSSPPAPTAAAAATKKNSAGLKEEVFYFRQRSRVPRFTGKKPTQTRTAKTINYASRRRPWSGLTKADHFAVRWTGYLAIAKKGYYRFYLKSDDGSKLYINKQQYINNDGLHGMRERSTRRYMTNKLHPLRVEFFEKGGGAGIEFRYNGGDSMNRKEIVPASALWQKDDTEAQLACRNYGLKEEFFFFRQGGRLPSLRGKKARITRTSGEVNYRNTGGRWAGLPSRDNFAAKWRGWILIHNPGSYTFYLSSDDGSKLYIDKKQVVDNDGLHGWRTKQGTRTLTAGSHHIKVKFFEKGGHAGIKLKFKGPDVGNFPIVIPKRFFRAPA